MSTEPGPIESKPPTELGNVGTLNHVTPRADSPTPHAPPTPNPPPGANVDRFGVVFDPGLHEPGAFAKDGRWKRLRGNGARKAAGKSIFIPPSTPVAPGVKKPIPPAPGVKPGVAPTPAPGGIASLLNIPGQPGIGAPGQLAPGLPESAYEDTGDNLSRGLWGLLELFGGKEWKGDAGEVSSYKSAFQRTWFKYQWPRLGPVISLLLLLSGSIAKRREAPATKKLGATVRGWFRKLGEWVTGRKSREVDPIISEDKKSTDDKGKPRG